MTYAASSVRHKPAIRCRCAALSTFRRGGFGIVCGFRRGCSFRTFGPERARRSRPHPCNRARKLERGSGSEHAFNADFRGGVTCIVDTRHLGIIQILKYSIYYIFFVCLSFRDAIEPANRLAEADTRLSTPESWEASPDC
jgi:hypothetical protein